MQKKFTPEDEYSNILSQFCYKCERTYRNLNPSVKGKVKDRLPTVFKKWFFSSVMENAVMSPAAILTHIPVRDYTLDENEFADCDLAVKGHRGGLEKYGFKNIIVSADSHPLIDDLKIFADFCSPVVFLDDELHLDKKAADELKPLLSLGDIYYIDYLTELSAALSIIEKMPSLYINAYKTADNADEFFSQSGRDILNDILLKVLEICSHKVINDLYISPNSFTAESLLEYFHTLIPVNDIIKEAQVLSGGERVRCMLCKMMMSGANVLILDEPTNHLDLESITALNEGLTDYKGTLLFCSHDHQFIQTIADRIIEILPGGIIDRKETYDEYIDNENVDALRERFSQYA